MFKTKPNKLPSGTLIAIQTTLAEVVNKQRDAPSEVFSPWRAVSVTRLLFANVGKDTKKCFVCRYNRIKEQQLPNLVCGTF